jgi:hypothetical protein
MANPTQDRVTRYYKIKNGNRNATHLKAEVYYALGGVNYFTYKNEPRGYYLSVIPVEIADRNGYVMESFTAFSGTKWIVLPVQRKSQKKFSEAIAYFETHINEYISKFSDFEVDLESYEVR